MNPEEVAQYLLNTPEFFEEHIETLMQITLPHPHGGRTVSLGERQLLALREKNKALEKKLHDLIGLARENEALQLKVHEFTNALFAARDLATLYEMIPHLIRDIFSVPHAVLHLWQITPPGIELLTFADEKLKPVCMHQPLENTAEWFGEFAGELKSFAYLPLHAGSESIGLLVLASEDRQRFYPEMGAFFLNRLADTVGSALHPYLDH